MVDIRKKHRFNVVTNSVGQRILIVDNAYRYFAYEHVPFEDFDAILFETEDYVVLKLQVMSIITIDNTPNYAFKAFFFNPSITNKTALVYADGMCTSIDSPELIQETRRIKERFITLKFKVFDREPSFWTPERRIFHVIRTYLLRSDKYPEWQVLKQSALGYAVYRLEMLVKYKFVTIKAAIQYLDKLCNQYKLLEQGELKAVVHLCPHCYENRLLWQEVCPKCGSIDIDEVNMIHHFRCANISSEESYIKDGKLICPKCRHELKHIGVDYDRPASMYHCRVDNIHFSTPHVKALCANCNKTSDMPELIKRKLYKKHYTNLGMVTFAQRDHVHDSDDIPKLPSIYAFNSFIHVLKIRVNIARANEDLRLFLFRMRVTPEDDYEMIDSDVIHRVYRLYPNSIISYRNGAFYLLHSFAHDLTKEIIGEILPIKELKRKNPQYDFDGDYMELDVNMNLESIIASI